MWTKYLDGCDLYAEIVELHPHPTSIVLTNGIILYTNKSLSKTLGYEHGELEGMHFADITHPDDLADDLDLFRKLNDGEIGEYEMKKRYLCKDGTLLDALLTVKPTKLQNKLFNVIYGFFLPDNYEVSGHTIKINTPEKQ